MPHTYSRLLTHVVWSTKERLPSIVPEIRPDVHAYLGGIVREEGGTAVVIGGTGDHVHLLIELPADRNVADCVRVVKTNSSRWVPEKWPDRRAFLWQAGYGAFAVSASNAARVIQYIQTKSDTTVESIITTSSWRCCESTGLSLMSSISGVDSDARYAGWKFCGQLSQGLRPGLHSAGRYAAWSGAVLAVSREEAPVARKRAAGHSK